ncbi:MAG: D-alanyl-D-alanine dipeptidase [Syntrophus sp. PtaB.Bin001]|nr:MAG: D-alanyl-D-alanine dipeptidase [Syntrophus sp. PtaB.Bin001]
MRHSVILTFLMLCMITAYPCYARDFKEHSQIIVSVTDSWSDCRTTLFLFEKTGEIWQRIGEGIEGVVGRFGLAWDPAADGRMPGEPVKIEGDLKAPAGIFPIPMAMGMSPKPPSGVTLPYRQIVKGTHCVDDPSSPYYNRIIREKEIPPDNNIRKWKSSEEMWKISELYRLLLVIGYNTQSPKAAEGSCIFIHLKGQSGKPTSGCTAVAEEDLIRIMKWLKSDHNPILVQLPRDVYLRVRQNRLLPSPELIENRVVKNKIPLVDIRTIAPDVAVEMRYAGSNNFTGKRIYNCGRCFLRTETAAKLAIAQKEMRMKGYSLKIWDCYRPPAAQELFWSLMPDPRYVANPKIGSRHGRGNAVDVTIVDSSGRELEMPTGFDDFTPRASHKEKHLPPQVIENRQFLSDTMEKAGFKRLESEWWHYEDGGGEIIDASFDELCHGLN